MTHIAISQAADSSIGLKASQTADVVVVPPGRFGRPVPLRLGREPWGRPTRGDTRLRWNRWSSMLPSDSVATLDGDVEADTRG